MRDRVRGRLRPWMVVGLAAVGLVAGREAWASDKIETTTVEFAGAKGPVRGFLARPKGDGPFPGIVVIHEWWGLTEWVKQNAERLAEHGYAALAVDLYGGKVTDDPKEAIQLMRGLERDAAVGDLKGAIGYLKARPYLAKGRPVGAIGWCMGGLYSRLAAQGSDAVGPAVICYGQVSADPAEVAMLKGKPVLGIFGAKDAGIPPTKVRQFLGAAEGAGSAIEVKIYEGAGHGFMRPGGHDYDAGATADAWARIDAFFKAHLAPAAP